MNRPNPHVSFSLRAATVFLVAAWAPPSAAQMVPASALNAYDFRADEVRQVELSGKLDEISGLALDEDGRLFAHQDERAIIFELDTRTGEILRTIPVGRNGRRGDWEGIAVAGHRIFLVDSHGELMELEEPEDTVNTRFTTVETGSRKVCDEIEGLEYDARANVLLLACKQPARRSQRDHLLILSFSLRTGTLDPSPRYDMPLGFLADRDLDEELSPSGIAIHPLTGTILVLASRERLLVEIGRSGTVLGVRRLRDRHHDQPEGIAVLADGTLIISDEADGDHATLTFYPWQPPGGQNR